MLNKSLRLDFAVFILATFKMSKTVGKMKMAKKLTEKIDHSSKLRVNILAGLASSVPPLGSQLGQVRILLHYYTQDIVKNQRNIFLKFIFLL